MRLLRIATSLVAVTALGLASCGDQHEPTACYLLDWGGSTRSLQADYMDAFVDATDRDMREGHALRVLLVRGDPRTESLVLTTTFAGLDSLEQQGKRLQRRGRLLSQLEGQIDDIQAGVGANTPGSAIAAGMSIVSAGGCEAGLTAYTDGLETDAFSVYRDDITTGEGRRQMAQSLDDDNAFGNLTDVTVAMPFGGIVPTGSTLPEPRKRALRPLWEELVRTAGGKLAWGQR